MCRGYLYRGYLYRGYLCREGGLLPRVGEVGIAHHYPSSPINLPRRGVALVALRSTGLALVPRTLQCPEGVS